MPASKLFNALLSDIHGERCELITSPRTSGVHLSYASGGFGISYDSARALMTSLRYGLVSGRGSIPADERPELLKRVNEWLAANTVPATTAEA